MIRALGLLLSGLAFGVSAGAAPSAACHSQFARQKINVVVPFKPGGGYDLYARLLAPVLEDVTGTRVAIVNMPAAQGHVAMKTVANPPASAITLGLMDLRVIMSRRLADPAIPPTSAYVALGSFGQSMGLWASKTPHVAFFAAREPITAAGGGGTGLRVLLPASLLQREVRFVQGYLGMNERVLALLRGEIDMVDGPDDTILRLTGNAGVAPIMVLARAPVPSLPGTPYLAGPGGLVDEATRNLPPVQRRRSMELADVAVGLATGIRSVIVASTVREPLRRCLEAAVEEALFSAQLREAAAKQKAAYEPMRGAQVREETARIERLMQRHLELLRDFVVRARS